MENILKLNFNMESIFYRMPFHFYRIFVVKVFLSKNKKKNIHFKSRKMPHV